uniref:Aminotransferase-like plant mobile domain-containing protein n=1 Tax=Arundo donax TaxID=35708 RepID=A0A0A9EJM8_ARUDO
MWLSLFVFAAPPFNVVRREVFPIAVRLARGQSMAVAPAALASIYNDLSMLKWHFSASKKMEPFGISAPMHILQLWVWERFPELRPEMASTPDHREVPRAARWHDVFKELNPKYVHAVFISPKEFEWRPYGSSKFSLPSETGACWVHGQDIAGNKELLSFARCLHSCELVGMDCIEKYRPHRVARQLGFDQDVPGTVARVNSKWKKAWDTYNIEAESSAFIVPIHKPGVTVEYVQWWEPYSLACASVVANAAKMKRLRIYVSPMKRKIEGLPAANSSKKLHVDTATRMPQPAPDVAEDPLDDIPLVERLNRIIKMMPKQQKTDCLVKSAEKEQIAENANCFIPRSANVGIKKAVLHRNVEQDLSDVATGSASIVMELSCGTVATKTQGNDMDIQVLREVAVLRNHDNVVVVSDDEFDEATGKEDAIFEEETLDEDFTVTMHLKSPKMETKGSILLESNEERQLVSKINDELDNPMLKDIMVQSIQDCEVAAVVNEEIDNRDKVHREDSVEVNIKKAGNRERSSSRLVDGITEVDTSVICTKTLYYLSPLDLVKKDQGKDANNSGIDQDVYLPKRAVGTMEMIKRVSAIRQAEIAELKEKIDNLKEEIRVLEAAE